MDQAEETVAIRVVVTRQLRLLPDYQRRAEEEMKRAENERKAAELRALEIEALNKQVEKIKHGRVSNANRNLRDPCHHARCMNLQLGGRLGYKSCH